MKTNRNIFLPFILFILSLSAILILLSQHANAFGISPPSLNFSFGSSSELEFYIYNNEDETKTYSITSQDYLDHPYSVKVHPNNSEKITVRLKTSEIPRSENKTKLYITEVSDKDDGISITKAIAIIVYLPTSTNDYKEAPSEDIFEDKDNAPHDNEGLQNSVATAFQVTLLITALSAIAINFIR